MHDHFVVLPDLIVKEILLRNIVSVVTNKIEDGVSVKDPVCTLFVKKGREQAPTTVETFQTELNKSSLNDTE